MYTYVPPLGSASKPDELCLSYPRNIASNILDVKVNEFTEVRDRDKMHLNKSELVVDSTSHKIVLGRRNIGLCSNKHISGWTKRGHKRTRQREGQNTIGEE